MERGRLIALEGLDGCGKSTQARRLVAALEADGRQVVATREPTDGPIGQRIRAWARSGESVAAAEELHWFLEDRAEHVRDVIAPGLERGAWVVTDRYFLSTVAYQGARGLDPAGILAACEARFPLPDLAVIFEIEPRQGLARVRARGAPLEPGFEQPEFLAAVAKHFAELDRPWIARLDGTGPEDSVCDALRALVRRRLA